MSTARLDLEKMDNFTVVNPKGLWCQGGTGTGRHPEETQTRKTSLSLPARAPGFSQIKLTTVTPAYKHSRRTSFGALWQIILDAHNHDEDTHLFLLEIRKIGPIRWALQRAVNVESDVLFMKYSQGVPIFNSTVTDATIVRRLLELLATGKKSGPCLVPGDAMKTFWNSGSLSPTKML